ncbi:transglutaminase-like cysteine peptidase [Hyphomicrobium sp. 2TAF46]|uniref:transglutaminase-like cysteine peptidase n=1 Tax=Hyphomicrobium sp. 2TAF46 TaxID=3233019 RepID=UPI003F93063F
MDIAMRYVVLMLAAPVALFVSPSTWADESLTRPQEVIRSLFMHEYGPVQAPPAFYRFCVENQSECLPRSAAHGFVETVQQLEQLDEVNLRVNRTIVPETDIAHYGIEDYWTIPKDGKGDCEDYALMKRHILISMGWPTSALLMTVVRIENGEGHAVLTARTNYGDLILDNRSNEILPWYQTAYSFKMRQSSYNPKIWVDLDPTDDVLPAPIAVPDLDGLAHLH